MLARFAGVIRYRYAPESVRIYSAVVRRWMQFGGLPGHIDGALLIRYLHARRDVVSDAAVNVDIKGLRLFYGVQIELGDASAVELEKIPRQRATVARQPRVLDESAVATLLTSIPIDTYDGLRDYVMIRLLLETGMRSGEVARMEVPDLLTDDSIYVPSPAGRAQDRYIPITGALAGLLRGYLHARAARGGSRVRAMWLTKHNRPLRGARAVWDVVSRRMWSALHRRAGVADLERAAVGRAWRGHGVQPRYA